MRKYLVGIVAALFMVAWAGLSDVSVPTTAQDQTEERLSALETRVAELEARVDALEGEQGDSARPAGRGSERGGNDILEISATGSTVTDDFHLEAGRYEVTLTLDSGCCISIFLYGPSGTDELLFSEIFGMDAQGGTVTDIFEAPESGSYFIDSQNTDGAWSIAFEKR